MDKRLEFPINPGAYQWTGRFMRVLRRMLKVNIRLHDDGDRIDAGDIFVFNHFARFETFIPQYLFWEHSGVHCRSVADRDLFSGSDRFANYLKAVGAIPNDHPELLALLAAEVLRGRKLIVFPEGGMVKDRQVLDAGGDYSVYSRSASQRRKHHSGAAVIALALEVFKQAVLHAEDRGDRSRLDSWCNVLGIRDHATLLARARRPTLIVPANITFYPLRVRGNPLLHGVEFFNRGISPRMREELLIEGNILLKDTDMDIRLGTPVRAADHWSERDRRVVAIRAARLSGLQDAFTTRSSRVERRLIANATRLQAERVRDAYMHGMYQLVTVNLSHLAALAIYELMDAGRTEIAAQELHRALYLAVKKLQRTEGVSLHRSLRNPEAYGELASGRSAGLDEFVRTAAHLGLIEQTDTYYRFLPKLLSDHDFDQVRLENPVEVFANEVAPLRPVFTAVADAIREVAQLSEEDFARLQFDDELRSLAWDHAQFDKPRHRAVNRLQTQTAAPSPRLEIPGDRRDVGVVLVHGFLASPAEVRGLGEALSAAGIAHHAVRLKGHGTSPWDLRSRTWHDWLASVRRGYRILAPFVDRICLVGFSTGGSLCLHMASEQPTQLAGVAAISAPMRFRDRNMAFVPFMHRTNRLVERVREHGVLPFRPNHPENPHINYAHMPIRALYELGCLVEDLPKHLAQIRHPALVMQGDADPVVDPASAQALYRAIGSSRKKLVMIPSRRHGIVHSDIGGTWAEILSFVEQCSRSAAAMEPADHLPETRVPVV